MVASVSYQRLDLQVADAPETPSDLNPEKHRPLACLTFLATTPAVPMEGNYWVAAIEPDIAFHNRDVYQIVRFQNCGDLLVSSLTATFLRTLAHTYK